MDRLQNMTSLFRSERLVLAAMTFWLSIHFLILGKYSLVLMGDEGDSTLSGLLSVPHVEGAFSLWSPFAALGIDRLAQGYNPPFLTLIFEVLPSWFAYASAHTAMVGGGVAGLFVLCRQHFDLTVSAALFSSLLFGSALSFQNLWLFPIALTPFCLFFTSRLLDDRSDPRRWMWVGVAALALASFSNVSFLVLFPPMLFFVWYLVLEQRFDWKDWVIIVGFFVVIYLLRGQGIAAMALNAGLSPRADWVQNQQSIGEAVKTGFSHAMTSASPLSMLAMFKGGRPDFFAMALYSFLVTALLTKVRLPGSGKLLSCFLASLLVVALTPVAKSLLYDVVPILRGFSANKFWFFAHILGFIGAGFAFQSVQEWAQEKSSWGDKRKQWVFASPFIVILFIGLVEKAGFGGYQWLTQGSYSYLYESPVIQRLAKRIKADEMPSRVASFQMYDVTVHAYGLESPGGNIAIYPKRYNQFWSKIVEQASHKLPSETMHLKTQGVMELGLAYVNPDKRPSRDLSELYRLNMFSLANVRYFLSRDQLTDPQFRELDFAKPESPWSALSQNQKITANIKDNFSGRSNLYVYENTQALPRFFLAEQFQMVDGRGLALEMIAATNTEALAKNVIIDQADRPSSLNIKERFSSDGEISIMDYANDRIELEISSNGPSLLIATNSYSPFWKAYVDGREIPIFPAYITLWGVRLPADAHKVTFRYEPPYRIF